MKTTRKAGGGVANSAITPDILAEARRRGIFREALRWAYGRTGPTWADLSATNRNWAGWIALHVPLPEDVAEYLYAVTGCRSWWWREHRHRDDGPALIHADGTEEWWRFGLRDRPDGPAIIHADGSTEWWRRGKKIDYALAAETIRPFLPPRAGRIMAAAAERSARAQPARKEKGMTMEEK
jgi:hypothetical protein